MYMTSAPATDQYGADGMYDMLNCSEEIFEAKTVLLSHSAFIGEIERKSIVRTLRYDNAVSLPETIPNVPIDFNQWESGNIYPQTVPAANQLDDLRLTSVKSSAIEDIPSLRAA
jgi:hypothetical protein